MAQTGLAGSVEAHVQGEISGQVAVGNHIIQIGSVHGGVVNLASPDQQPSLRARPAPVLLRPRPFRGLLDREAEVEVIGGALEMGTPVDLYGQAGQGKTSLLRHLAHNPPEGRFPDGIVYLSARHTSLTDLLQSLFDAFYESDQPLKPTEAQIRHRLGAKRALVVLDDTGLGRGEVETLMDVAPVCVFVVASTGRKLWGEGQAIALEGLPLEHAQTLLERELGRRLTPPELPAFETLHAALGGHPLCLIQAAALVREEGRSLDALTDALSSSSADQVLAAQQLDSLSEPERQVLATLAVLKGAPLPAEHLAALVGLADVQLTLDALDRRGLLQAHSPRYSLTGSLNETLAQAWDLAPTAERALAHFARWAEAQTGVEAILVEQEALLQILEWASDAVRWPEVLRLGRALEAALAIGARWGAWEQVLLGTLQASQALGDRAAQAWSLHQLGSRALCLGDAQAARVSLSEALRLRQALGDRAGATMTQHNLDVLVGPPPPPEKPAEPSEPPSARPAAEPKPRGISLKLKVGIAALVATVLVVVTGYVVLSDTSILWVENGEWCGELEPEWDPLLSSLPGVSLFDRISPGEVGKVQVPAILLGDVQVETRPTRRGLEATVKTRLGDFDFSPEGYVVAIELDGGILQEGRVYDVETHEEHHLLIICEP